MANSAYSKGTRNRKIEEEMRNFNEKWTSEYFFIENADSRPLQLICKQAVSVNKEYNHCPYQADFFQWIGDLLEQGQIFLAIQ